MFRENDRVSVSFFEGQRIGVIKTITPESEESYGSVTVTLEEDGRDIIIKQSDFSKITIIWQNGEIEENSWWGWFSEIIEEPRKIVAAVVVVIVVVYGSYIYMKQHHATKKVLQEITQTPEKTQIQTWADEMAALEVEKAGHYERQKYLRSEDKKEIAEVKKLDKKINEIKDKIHLYVTPSEND